MEWVSVSFEKLAARSYHHCGWANGLGTELHLCLDFLIVMKLGYS